MKTTGFRSIVLYLLLAVFLGGFGYLFVSLCMNGSKWIAQPYNGHIYAEDATTDTGTITDRNGVLLANSHEGKRLYAENSTIRQSLLHTVGDSSGYISTSVQSQMRAKLMGYNLFTGLNRTPLSALGANNIKLTVDADLCATAYEALEGKTGAVLLYNYKTGEVLCKVSTPTYDPMQVPENLSEDPAYEGVFLDHTISSAFVPGSIFKLVTAACAMEHKRDWETLTYDCQGAVTIGTGTVTCLGTHGTQSVEAALGNSCNVYFALLAADLGGTRLQKTAESMGFNKNFSFQDFSTAKSRIALQKATPLELGWAGVGQHTLSTNPAHMLVLMGAIAQGGKGTPPRITEKGLLSTPTQAETLVSSTVAGNLSRLMRSTVQNYYGDSLFPDMAVCAKTGTAEVGEGKSPTSWIVGFSQNSETPYAFSIAVEEGGSGMGFAGNLASTLMNQLA